MRRGFGTRLIEQSLAHGLGPGASVRLDVRCEGLHAEIRFTAAEIRPANSNNLEATVRAAARDAG